MGFWDDVKKDFQRSLKESVHLLKEKAIVMKEKAEELTEEGKKRYKIFDIQMRTQKEVGELGGRIYMTFPQDRHEARNGGFRHRHG